MNRYDAPVTNIQNETYFETRFLDRKIIKLRILNIKVFSQYIKITHTYE